MEGELGGISGVAGEVGSGDSGGVEVPEPADGDSGTGVGDEETGGWEDRSGEGSFVVAGGGSSTGVVGVGRPLAGASDR